MIATEASPAAQAATTEKKKAAEVPEKATPKTRNSNIPIRLAGVPCTSTAQIREVIDVDAGETGTAPSPSDGEEPSTSTAPRTTVFAMPQARTPRRRSASNETYIPAGKTKTQIAMEQAARPPPRYEGPPEASTSHIPRSMSHPGMPGFFDWMSGCLGPTVPQQMGDDFYNVWPMLPKPPEKVLYLRAGPECWGPVEYEAGCSPHVAIPQIRPTMLGPMYTFTVARIVDMKVTDPRLMGGFTMPPQWATGTKAGQVIRPTVKTAAPPTPTKPRSRESSVGRTTPTDQVYDPFRGVMTAAEPATPTRVDRTPQREDVEDIAIRPLVIDDSVGNK